MSVTDAPHTADEGVPQAEHIRFLVDPRSTLAALAGQRRRLASAVEVLSADELAASSRCEGWSVADVLRHLVWVDRTARGLWSGEAMIAGFDPRTTPDEAVHADRTVPDEEIRRRYLSSTEMMTQDLEGADPQRFGQPSLSPAGRVPWWMSAVHMGWDSSIHERDILFPLGREVRPPAREVEPCLAYTLILASFFAGREGLSVRAGTVEMCRAAGVVTAGPLAGSERIATPAEATTVADVAFDDPVEAIDALSGRGPLEGILRGDAAVVGRLGGMARYFTAAPG